MSEKNETNETNKDNQTETSSQDMKSTSTEGTKPAEDSQKQTTEAPSSNPIADAIKGEEGEKPADDKPADDKPADDKPAEEADPKKGEGEKPKEGDEEKPAEGAEEYDLILKEDSPLSDEDLDKIAESAEKHGWTKEEAEAEISRWEGLYNKGQEIANKPHIEYFNKQKELFDKDHEFQGDNKDASYMSIKRAVDKFGNPELLEQLNQPQIGNNYHLAKFLKTLGDALGGGDKELLGKGAGGDQKGDPESERLRNLYPSMFK